MSRYENLVQLFAPSQYLTFWIPAFGKDKRARHAVVLLQMLVILLLLTYVFLLPFAFAKYTTVAFFVIEILFVAWRLVIQEANVPHLLRLPENIVFPSILCFLARKWITGTVALVLSILAIVSDFFFFGCVWTKAKYFYCRAWDAPLGDMPPPCAGPYKAEDYFNVIPTDALWFLLSSVLLHFTLAFFKILVVKKYYTA